MLLSKSAQKPKSDVDDEENMILVEEIDRGTIESVDESLSQNGKGSKDFSFCMV